MSTVHPQFVFDEDQHLQAVLLPVAEWERIVEDLEELDDIRAYDEATVGPQDAVPLDQAIHEIDEGRVG
ncbi:MAG: hypothetical protein ABFC96_02890 [Thermoguttaceae bacterium]